MAGAKRDDEGKIVFFSEMDYNKEGKPSAQYPSWYFDVHLDSLKNDAERIEHQIKMELIPQSEIAIQKNNLKKYRERIAKIEEGRPKLGAVDKDKVYSAYKEIGDRIADSLFTRSDMMKGTADAHEEARRMSEPCIPVTPEMREYVLSCNRTPVSGKISRNDLSDVWKTMGKALGEPTNVEVLRRD
jgi:hypothetical protein